MRQSKHFAPIVVCTSNSEKGLPDPFLRRCIYYNIPFPSGDLLHEIVTKRLGSQVERNGLLDDALKLIDQIREAPGMHKKPATAELLDWLQTLSRVRDSSHQNVLRTAPAERILSTLVCLIKSEEDLNPSSVGDSKPANKVLQEWIRTRQ